jgi:hypothetical protein
MMTPTATVFVIDDHEAVRKSHPLPSHLICLGLSNKRESLSELSRRYWRALVVMEAGCHSPWISLGPRFIRLDCRRTTSATSNRNPLPPFAGLPCRFCRRSPRRLWGRSSVSDRAQRVRVSFPLASARSFRQAWSNLIVFGSDLFAQRSMA